MAPKYANLQLLRNIYRHIYRSNQKLFQQKTNGQLNCLQHTHIQNVRTAIA